MDSTKTRTGRGEAVPSNRITPLKLNPSLSGPPVPFLYLGRNRGWPSFAVLAKGGSRCCWQRMFTYRFFPPWAKPAYGSAEGNLLFVYPPLSDSAACRDAVARSSFRLRLSLG